MKNRYLLFYITLIAGITVAAVSCSKESVTTNGPLPAPVPSASFVEEFDTVGNLRAKGWIFRNNSFPAGASGWRQGRYEAATGQQYKWVGPVSFYGFPAYSARNTPNDFVSCDVTAGNDANTGTADINAWLISPQLPMRNGDSITFYTRAIDDTYYGYYATDRLQVRANFTDGTDNVGGGAATTGSFSTVLLDINPTYIFNDPAGNTSGASGYPRVWTRYKIVVSGIQGDSIRNGRFAFRYLSADAGLFGGSSGEIYPSVVGIDSLAFGHR
jgi:hypothetical protein